MDSGEMFEKIKLPYDSPEWLAFRKNGIGGSDTAAILGLSPFKSNVDLYLEKIGNQSPQDLSDNPLVKYGKDAEDLLFRLFALDHPEYTCTTVKDIVYKREFMFASLDGQVSIQDQVGVYEGKTATLRKRADLAKWDNQIPDYYYTQILHYLIVTGYDFAILNAQLKLSYLEKPEKITKEYFFRREEVKEDMEYLYTEEKKFWGCVTDRKCPPLILQGFGKETI